MKIPHKYGEGGNFIAKFAFASNWDALMKRLHHGNRKLAKSRVAKPMFWTECFSAESVRPRLCCEELPKLQAILLVGA